MNTNSCENEAKSDEVNLTEGDIEPEIKKKPQIIYHSLTYY
jgi:hypothetical protein